MIPLSKMKAKLPPVKKLQASTQTVVLKNPSDIRLPSYSAFYTETMYRVDSKNYENLYANKYKMEVERLKVENKKFLRDIEKFQMDKEKLEMRLKELMIAYEILWNEEKKKQKVYSLKQAKKKRATMMNEVVFGEVIGGSVFANTSHDYEDENIENSAVLLKKDKKEILYNNLQLNKNKYDQILDVDLQNMIDEQLRTVIKLKDLNISELKKEKQKLISNNEFLKKQYDELVKIKMVNKQLEQKNQTRLNEVNGLKLLNKELRQEKNNLQKDYSELQQDIRLQRQMTERYNKDLNSFSQNLDLEEKKIKEFLKEANQNKEGVNSQAVSIYKQTIEYLLFMVKKCEKRYLDELKKWEMERSELERELRIQEGEIERLKLKKTIQNGFNQSNKTLSKSKKVLKQTLSRNKG